MNVSRSKWSEVSPCYWVEIICVQPTIVLQNHRCVAFEDFKEENDIFAADIGCMLVDNELFIPSAHVLSRDTHIEEPCAHGHQVVDRFVGNRSVRVN